MKYRTVRISNWLGSQKIADTIQEKYGFASLPANPENDTMDQRKARSDAIRLSKLEEEATKNPTLDESFNKLDKANLANGSIPTAVQKLQGQAQKLLDDAKSDGWTKETAAEYGKTQDQINATYDKILNVSTQDQSIKTRYASALKSLGSNETDWTSTKGVKTYKVDGQEVAAPGNDTYKTDTKPQGAIALVNGLWVDKYNQPIIQEIDNDELGAAGNDEIQTDKGNAMDWGKREEEMVGDYNGNLTEENTDYVRSPAQGSNKISKPQSQQNSVVNQVGLTSLPTSGAGNQAMLLKLLQDFDNRQGQANKANESRYQQTLNLLAGTNAQAQSVMDQTGSAERARIQNSANQENAIQEQKLINRGLGNSTVLSSVRNNTMDTANMGYNDLASRLAQAKSSLISSGGSQMASVMASKNEVGPQSSLYGSIARQLGLGVL